MQVRRHPDARHIGNDAPAAGKLPEVKAEAPVVPENAEADEQDRDALGNDSGDSHPGYSEREADDKQKIEDDVDAAGYQKNQERMAGIPDRRRMPAPML